MLNQFNIYQLYALPTLYLYFVFIYNKQELAPLTALNVWFLKQI